MAMWDLPEQEHSRKRTRKHRRRSKEPDLGSNVNTLMNTTSNFMLGAMGIAVMSNMGHAVITSLND